MCAGVSKSGSPISRWTISRPARSSALALASTSNADSVPSLAMRAAMFIACLSQATHGGRVLALRCEARPIIATLPRVDFVEVAAGPFRMGSASGHPGERPVHEVWVDAFRIATRSEEHTSELQSQSNLVCRLLLEKKKNIDD